MYYMYVLGRLDEEQSDRCMSELIGSHKSGGKPCDISSQCISIMTSPGLLGYGITHQVLWTLLAEKVQQIFYDFMFKSFRGKIKDHPLPCGYILF